MIKKYMGVIGLCIAVVLGGCSDGAVQTAEMGEVQNEESKSPGAIDVFGEVKVETLREVVIDFPAFVEAIHVKDGEKVKKGTPLITLNFEEYEITIGKKRDEIKLYQEQLSYLKENMNPLASEIIRLKKELLIKEGYLNGEDPEIKTLERGLEIILDALKTIEKEYSVSQEIFHIGGISQKELDVMKEGLLKKEKEKNDTLDAIEVAKTKRETEVEQLRSSLRSNEAQLSNTDKQNEMSISELEYKLQTGKKDLQIMEAKLTKSYLVGKNIIADTDELILYELLCNEGAAIGQGEGPLIKLMDEKTLFVSADIPEEFISKVKVGSQAEIIPYADKTITLPGKVTRLAEKAIKQNGEVIIKADIALEGQKEMLKPGLTVDIMIYE